MNLSIETENKKSIEDYMDKNTGKAIVPLDFAQEHVMYVRSMGVGGSDGTSYQCGGALLIDLPHEDYKRKKEYFRNIRDFLIGRTAIYHIVGVNRENNQTELRKLDSVIEKIRAARFIYSLFRDLRFYK